MTIYFGIFFRHVDGNHKLIKWRFVIHGGIDGFSRTIVFLRCSDNNRAETVLSQFLSAITRYRIPLRVRTDHGTENVAMARWMLQHFGPDNKPMLTGLSVHNQRIERLWVDVYRYVIDQFRNVFSFLESEDTLESTNELDLYALHYTFMPRINFALDEMANHWNNHPLRTENNQSPMQLWVRGFYQYMTNDGSSVHDILNRTQIDWNQYGVDPDSPDAQIETNNHVVVPRSEILLSEPEFGRLSTQIEPLTSDVNFGVPTYLRCRQVLSIILEERNAST